MRHPRLDRLMNRAGGRRRTAGRQPGTPGTGSGGGPTGPHAPRLSPDRWLGRQAATPPIASMIPIAASARRAGRLIAVKLIGSVTGILGSRLSSRSNFRANCARRFSEKLNRGRDMVRSFPWQRNLRNAHPCRGRDWSGDLTPEPGTDGAATEGRPAALACARGSLGAGDYGALFLNAKKATEAAPKVAALMARELAYDANWVSAQLVDFERLPGTSEWTMSLRAADRPWDMSTCPPADPILAFAMRFAADCGRLI